MNAPDSRLWIPGVRPDGSRYPPVSRSAVAQALRAALSLPAPVPTGLRTSGPWRLVLPSQARRGPPVEERLRALEPLRRLRREASPLVFPSEEALRDEASVRRWVESHAAMLYEEAHTLLLVGHPTELPWALQQQLGLSHRVGRLAFESVEDYARYASRVAASSPGPQSPRVGLFGVDDDDLTAWGRRLIVEPLAARLSERLPPDHVHLRLGEEATSAGLGEQLSRCQVLFALCHGGESFAEGDDGLGALWAQGAQDAGGTFRASEVADLPTAASGGAVVLFACHGLGCGLGDRLPAFLPAWATEELAAQEDRLSPLPGALLAHPQGPVGVVGHIGRAYLWAVYGADGGEPTHGSEAGLRPLHSMMDMICRGISLGRAMWPLQSQTTRRLDELRQHLGAAVGRSSFNAADDDALIQRWVTWSDSYAWALMGDPAAAPPWGAP